MKRDGKQISAFDLLLSMLIGGIIVGFVVQQLI